jgi:hypothetical protein
MDLSLVLIMMSAGKVVNICGGGSRGAQRSTHSSWLKGDLFSSDYDELLPRIKNYLLHFGRSGIFTTNYLLYRSHKISIASIR